MERQVTERATYDQEQLHFWICTDSFKHSLDRTLLGCSLNYGRYRLNWSWLLFLVYFYLQCKMYILLASYTMRNIFRPLSYPTLGSCQRPPQNSEWQIDWQWDPFKHVPALSHRNDQSGPETSCGLFVLWKTVVMLGQQGDLWFPSLFQVCECSCLISQIMNERVDDVIIMCNAGRHPICTVWTFGYVSICLVSLCKPGRHL